MMSVNNFSNLDQYLQHSPEFWPNSTDLLDTLQRSGETTSFHFLSIMLQKLTTPVIFLFLLTTFNLLVVVPANIVTAVVIIKSKELWTSSNVVLAINGIVQATGSLICLVGRCGGFALLPYFDQSQKHVFYVIGWWSYTIMMRTGNNRLAIKSQIFYWNLEYKNNM